MFDRKLLLQHIGNRPRSIEEQQASHPFISPIENPIQGPVDKREYSDLKFKTKRALEKKSMKEMPHRHAAWGFDHDTRHQEIVGQRPTHGVDHTGKRVEIPDRYIRVDAGQSHPEMTIKSVVPSIINNGVEIIHHADPEAQRGYDNRYTAARQSDINHPDSMPLGARDPLARNPWPHDPGLWPR